MYGYCDTVCKYKKEDKLVNQKYICKGNEYDEFKCIEVCTTENLYKNNLYSNKNSLIERNGTYGQSKTYIDIGHSLNTSLINVSKP